jgi:hypothetical protein
VNPRLEKDVQKCHPRNLIAAESTLIPEPNGSAEEKEYFIDMFGLFLKMCRDGIAVTNCGDTRELPQQQILTSAQKLTNQQASIDCKTPSTSDETPHKQGPSTVWRFHPFHVPLGLRAS